SKAAPGIARVDYVDIKPTDAERKSFAVTLRPTTSYMPSRSPEGDVAVTPEVVEARAADLARLNRLVDRYVLTAPPPPPKKDPPPPPPPVETEAPKAPPPRPPAYLAWRITGLWQGSNAAIATLSGPNNATRNLAVGEDLFGASLVSIETEAAVFESDRGRIRVPLGQTLKQGKPAS
ncbi:MAG: hypothetical protein AAF747_00485, partial [Planctomycetota bacterium]